MRGSFSALALAAVLAAPVTYAHRPPTDAAAFAADTDTWMQAALDRVEVVPAIAIAVVVGDEVVLTRGYGAADREAGTAATDETLFYIASATKSFTGLLATILDARGVIDLASPLADHLDGVSLAPELLADRVTLRELLTHTSGIDNDPIGYRVAYSGEHDPETLWRLLESSTAAEDAPRGTFLYNNVGYNIYGMIVDRETGVTWQEHLDAEIFTPLGMTRTSAYASRGPAHGWPVAAPYFGLDPGGTRRLYLEKQDDTMQSAGGMMTTARDVARWLELQITNGRLDGRRIVSEDVMERTHEVLVEAPDRDALFGQTGYGLGWSHGTHRDHHVISHGGGFPGFRSIISFMPDESLGVAIMVNEPSIGGMLLELATERAYDWWLGADLAEDDAALDSLAAKVPAYRERMAAQLEARAKRQWMLSRPRPAYAGTFVSDLFGTLTIDARDGALHVQNGNLRAGAEPFERPETIRLELIPGRGQLLVFEPAEGDVERVLYDDTVFTRVGAGD